MKRLIQAFVMAVAVAAGITGCAVTGGQESTGQYVDDATITTRVKTGLSKEPLLNNTAVDVDTKDHVVTLRGTVGSGPAKTRAEEIATATSGVSRVVNELVVR